jgi:hypothetical protein
MDRSLQSRINPRLSLSPRFSLPSPLYVGKSSILLSTIPLLTSNVAISSHPSRGKTDCFSITIASTFRITTIFVWNYYNNTTILLLPAITALIKQLNCCHAITGTPACMLTSSLTSPPANYAPAASRRVISNMASSHRSLFPPDPGNLYHATSSSNSSVKRFRLNTRLRRSLHENVSPRTMSQVYRCSRLRPDVP